MWLQLPGLFTSSIAAIVGPRSASREPRRRLARRGELWGTAGCVGQIVLRVSEVWRRDVRYDNACESSDPVVPAGRLSTDSTFLRVDPARRLPYSVITNRTRKPATET